MASTLFDKALSACTTGCLTVGEMFDSGDFPDDASPMECLFFAPTGHRLIDEVLEEPVRADFMGYVQSPIPLCDDGDGDGDGDPLSHLLIGEEDGVFVFSQAEERVQRARRVANKAARDARKVAKKASR